VNTAGTHYHSLGVHILYVSSQKGWNFEPDW
jgi:hypothetical protein